MNASTTTLRTSPGACPDSDAAAALTALYVRLRPAVLGRCRFILGDVASAEDATQETFLRAHRHAGRFPQGTDLRPWLLRIATNVCLSELRSLRRRRRREALERWEPAPPMSGRPAVELAIAERVLESAPVPVQQAVRLCCLDGLEQSAAASALDVSTRTVAARLARFRRDLRRALEQESSNARPDDSSL